MGVSNYLGADHAFAARTVITLVQELGYNAEEVPPRYKADAVGVLIDNELSEALLEATLKMADAATAVEAVEAGAGERYIQSVLTARQTIKALQAKGDHGAARVTIIRMSMVQPTSFWSRPYTEAEQVRNTAAFMAASPVSPYVLRQPEEADPPVDVPEPIMNESTAPIVRPGQANGSCGVAGCVVCARAAEDEQAA